MPVLVIGAAGNIGRQVVAALLDMDAEVVAFVRDNERNPRPGSPLANPAVRIEVGDLADPNSVLRAAIGCQSVFVLTPHSPEQVELQKSAVDAAAAVDAAVVKVSSWTPSVSSDSPVPGSRRHWLTQQYMRHRQIPFTTLGPNYFQHNLVNRYAGGVRRDGVLRSPAGDRGISMVDARDVAEVEGKDTHGNDHAGLTYTLSGPRAYTYPEIAAMLTELTGHEVEYHDQSEEEFTAWMAGENRQPWETEHAAAIFRMYREGAGELVTEDVQRITGHPPRPLESFLREVRAKFMPEQLDTVGTHAKAYGGRDTGSDGTT